PQILVGRAKSPPSRNSATAYSFAGRLGGGASPRPKKHPVPSVFTCTAPNKPGVAQPTPEPKTHRTHLLSMRRPDGWRFFRFASKGVVCPRPLVNKQNGSSGRRALRG